MVNQLKKVQGETNKRLERLLAAQQRTNQLLEWLGTLLASATEVPLPSEATLTGKQSSAATIVSPGEFDQIQPVKWPGQ